MEIQSATCFSHLITELPENKASHQTIALTKGKSQRHRSFLTTFELGFLPTIRIETTTYLLQRIYCQVLRTGGNGRLNLPHVHEASQTCCEMGCKRHIISELFPGKFHQQFHHSIGIPHLFHYQIWNFLLAQIWTEAITRLLPKVCCFMKQTAANSCHSLLTASLWFPDGPKL